MVLMRRVTLSCAGDDETCHEGTGDVRHPEELLGGPGHDEGEGEGDNGVALEAVVVVMGEPPGEEPVHDETHDNGEHQEAEDLEHDHTNVDGRIRHAGYKREADDAENIVNDSRSEDRVARFCSHAVHLLQGLHGDAHGGGGEDDTDEEVLKPGFGTGVVEHADDVADDQGNNDAKERNDEGLEACTAQVGDAGFQTGGEHDDDDAQFR